MISAMCLRYFGKVTTSFNSVSNNSCACSGCALTGEDDVPALPLPTLALVLLLARLRAIRMLFDAMVVETVVLRCYYISYGVHDVHATTAMITSSPPPHSFDRQKDKRYASKILL